MNPQLPNNQFKGLTLCTRYAFMPNKLQYCGGDKNKELFEYGVRNTADPFLTDFLKEFQTLMPYLQLIAESNKIKDPFDYRVVEAYWLGNELLEGVTMKKFYSHFIDGLNLKKKLKPKDFEKLIGKIPHNALPHHSFHVFNVWLRTGNLPIIHTLATMDNCRISWGKVLDVDKNDLEVLSSPLIINGNKLALGKAIRKKIIYKFYNKSFIEPKVNDWISFHWGWACDILSSAQVKNLIKYTWQSIELANRQ